jgi:hypothetical protein
LPPFPITEDKISLGKFDASPLSEALELVYVIGAPSLRECRHLQREAQKISHRISHLRYADKEAANNSPGKITNSVVFTF